MPKNSIFYQKWTKFIIILITKSYLLLTHWTFCTEIITWNWVCFSLTRRDERSFEPPRMHNLIRHQHNSQILINMPKILKLISFIWNVVKAHELIFNQHNDLDILSTSQPWPITYHNRVWRELIWPGQKSVYCQSYQAACGEFHRWFHPNWPC